MSYLLDTNACIEYLRKRNVAVMRQMQARPPREIRLCTIVAGELYHGACRTPRRVSNLTQLQQFFNQFEVLPFDLNAAAAFGDIRATLESVGMRIGPYDLQIAAVALANDLTLVTHNVAEFSRVPSLKLQDWQV